MKKYLNYSFIYMILALIMGVFYREFTKINNYNETTSLGKIHVHLFLLGMVVFMFITLFAKEFDLKKVKAFKYFLPIYNIGILLTTFMMLIRGIIQVKGINISKGLNASISGFSGIAHLFLAIGLFILFYTLKKASDK